MTMSEHDEKLCDWARSLSCFDWDLIHPEDAETAEGKKTLDAIQKYKYHKEEYHCGLD